MSRKAPQSKSQSKSQSPVSKAQARKPPPKQSNRTWIIAGIVAVVVAVAVLIAVAAGGSDSGGGSSSDAVEVAPVEVTGTPLPQYPARGAQDTAIGDTVPTLSGQSIYDGSALTIEPTGKPQVVVFLAHWCPHCQAEVPVIVDLADEGVLDGIDVAGVATGTRKDAANYPPSTWLQDENWPFPVMADSATATAARAYGLTGYPNMTFMDASGKVVARSQGEVTSDVLRAALKDLKAGQPVSLGDTGSSSSAG